jgi:hypothetical protein
MANAVNEYNTWLPSVASMVYAIAHHTYNFPNDATYSSYIASAKQVAPGKPTWMSEICCTTGKADASDQGWKQGYDPTINNGLHYASMMMQSFIVGSEPHYDFWTLVSPMIGCSPTVAGCATSANTNGWTDGVIYYDSNYASNKNYNLYLTKHYWTLKHFGNFVTPGSVRHDVSGASTRTLVVYTDTEVRILAMNPGTSDLSVPITFQDGIGTRLKATAAYRTSQSEDFASVTLPTSSSGTWTLSLRSMSLTSFIFSRS